MAATRIIPLHINKGKTLSDCLHARIDYAQNPDKTEQGELVSAYECDPMTAAEEFLLAKRMYDQQSHRPIKGDIIAYQIRQSFLPGEITPEEANRIGYELAMRFTKGKHAFIVSTHTDRPHIHNHIIFNSTTLDCNRKFKNFFLSYLAVQRLSDVLCFERGLSIITPKPFKDRVKRTEYPNKVSHRKILRGVLDDVLAQNPSDLDDLIRMMSERGYECKRGKHLAFRNRDIKRFIRLRSLGTGYSELDLADAITGSKAKRKLHQKSTHRHDKKQFDLLIDIEKRIKEGKGAGYERWAKVFNLKQTAQALCFLRDNNIRSIEALIAAADKSADSYGNLTDVIKEKEARLTEIAELKKHILNYSKTRETYVAYRKAGYSKKFFEEHRDEITLHKAAKDAFNRLGLKKLPKIKELNAEYKRVLAEKKAAYTGYREAKKKMQEYAIARKNVETILGLSREQTEQQKKNEQARQKMEETQK
ncbi:MAG: relaxase/mobilization nuclease domain-containing protein [Lachnospiraceae bacterium]|nr:relaxase/mobilization nuclease domain-containing protein [Lachnospiraceae bacterium]